MTSPGMSIQGSVETSCMIRASGNRGARRSGVTGSWVPGCSGGWGCIPACTIDGMMLNQAVGMSSGPRLNCTRSLIAPLLARNTRSRDYPPAPSSPSIPAIRASGRQGGPRGGRIRRAEGERITAKQFERIGGPPREAARLEALARVAGAAALGGGVHGVPAAIAEGVEEAFGPVAVLNVYEPETDRYVVRAVAGEASELMGTSSASEVFEEMPRHPRAPPGGPGAGGGGGQGRADPAAGGLRGAVHAGGRPPGRAVRPPRRVRLPAHGAGREPSPAGPRRPKSCRRRTTTRTPSWPAWHPPPVRAVLAGGPLRPPQGGGRRARPAPDPAGRRDPGGTIHVASKPGAGSSFSVWLPRTLGHPPRAD